MRWRLEEMVRIPMVHRTMCRGGGSGFDGEEGKAGLM